MEISGNQYIRKTEKTKQSVHRALTELLEKKDLRQVTVLELCKRAGINRSTFYNHYGSPFEVIREMGDEFLESISQKLSALKENDRESVERQVALCFKSAAENRKLVLLLMEHPYGGEFEERLFALPKIGELLDEALRDCPDEGERNAAVSFAIHGACHLMEEWLKDGCPVSPEEEADLILSLARRVCRA